jgi:tetratricopeptide (TPR) repeat protein
MVIALASCISVSFQVEHPPVIDLRNIKTITVIPFEWSSSGRDEHLSRSVTSALINGIRRGKIEYVDPQALENVSALNYWKYADVYIAGRITNARTSRSNETREESYRNYYSNKQETVTIRIITITTTVEIEYSYIRSVDGKVLGRFSKSETDSRSYEQPGDRNEYRNPNRNPGRPPRQEGAPRVFQQGREVDTVTAEAAIAKFSYTMDHELGPYTTTEKRKIRNTMIMAPKNNRHVTEANTYIRQGRYDEALTLYRDIYKQNSGAAAGYNTAVLLAANEKYTDALELLTEFNKRTEASGKRSPLYIQREIKKLIQFINGFRILEAYRKNETTNPNSNNPARVSETEQKKMASGQIRGTANINEAVVYALKDPISSMKDPSVFTKLAASASVNKGQWSMNVPDGVPSSLWFVLIDDGRYFYISKTPLNISASVVLDTALMNRLEEN